MQERARDVGPWSLEKLAYLKDYLVEFAKVSQSTRAATYLDLCAGPGQDRNRDNYAEIIDGSPLIALSNYPKIQRYIFIEQEPRNVESLRETIRERGYQQIRTLQVIPGDCNLVIDEALAAIPSYAPSFAFVDPAGLEIKWQTIQKIATVPGRRRRIEQFVLFPLDMALIRFFLHEGDISDVWGSQVIQRIDELMPDKFRWRWIFKERQSGSLSSTETRRRLAYLYYRGFYLLGYKHVLQPKLVVRPDGHPLYLLLFATDHEPGMRIMDYVLHVKPRLDKPIPLFRVESFEFGDEDTWYGPAGEPIELPGS